MADDDTPATVADEVAETVAPESVTETAEETPGLAQVIHAVEVVDGKVETVLDRLTGIESRIPPETPAEQEATESDVSPVGVPWTHKNPFGLGRGEE